MTLEEAARAVLNSDERGRGVTFDEALRNLHKALAAHTAARGTWRERAREIAGKHLMGTAAALTPLTDAITALVTEAEQSGRAAQRRGDAGIARNRGEAGVAAAIEGGKP